MQNVTNLLVEYCRGIAHHRAEPQLSEDEVSLKVKLDFPTKESALALDIWKLDAALSLFRPECLRTYFDISSLPSHRIESADSTWQESLYRYMDDARPLRENWTSGLTMMIDKSAIVRATNLPPDQHAVRLFFLTSSLLELRKLPTAEQLKKLFPDPWKKTVCVILDKEVFCDGPFICVSDWDNLRRVGPLPPAVSSVVRETLGTVREQCTWRGFQGEYLPEFIETVPTDKGDKDFLAWLSGMGVLLSLVAVANAAEIHENKAELTFWGYAKRSIVLNGAVSVSEGFARQSKALYAWVYHQVPHPLAALRIIRNLLAQNLGEDPSRNSALLISRLPDVLASAKANYAAFVQDKLDDFFELRKEISNYTTADAEYVYKKVADLNDYLLKSLITTLGLVVAALLSAAAAQISPLAYSAVLVAYSLYVGVFHVWYLPSAATTEFQQHVRRLAGRLQPYKEFLDPGQIQELFRDTPATSQKAFARTRTVVRLANAIIAVLICCLSGFDFRALARSFAFEPTWALGKAILALLAWARQII
jgi:hypothetical protein